jgi:hypothetical protein
LKLVRIIKLLGLILLTKKKGQKNDVDFCKFNSFYNSFIWILYYKND